MALTPWRGLWESRFPSLREEMDKMFEDFFGKQGFPSIAEGAWVPPIDVEETKKDIVVIMDIPAIDPKEVSISIIEDRVTIKGERKTRRRSKRSQLLPVRENLRFIPEDHPASIRSCRG